MPTTHRTYAVFEGGGARGIEHLGVLNTLELGVLDRKLGVDAKFDLRGYAGTSIGAVLAGLAAAGYTSDELFDKETGRSPLFPQLGINSATNIFGRYGWAKIYAFRFVINWAIPCTILALALFLALSAAAAHYGGVIALIAFQLLVLAAFVALVRTVIHGLCSTDFFIQKLNQALKRKVPCQGDIVCFRDLQKELRIVATDITGQRVHTFSTVILFAKISRLPNA